MHKLHKGTPRDISFSYEFGPKVHYSQGSWKDFCYPWPRGKAHRLLHLKKGKEHEVEHYENQQTVMTIRQDFADSFELGKPINHIKNLSMPSLQDSQ